jgi:hypothetical protein
MKRKTINSEMQEEWQRIVAYLDSVPLARDLRQARLASLRQLQSATGRVAPKADAVTVRAATAGRGLQRRFVR